MIDKGRLVEIVNWAATQERRVIGRLWDEPSASPDDWNARDIVWHLAAWRRQMVSHLSNLCLDTDLPVRDGGDDSENAVIFAEGREKSAEEIRRQSQAAIDDLLAALEATPAACLEKRISGTWRDGEPAWEAVVGSCCTHVLEHVWQLLLPRGELAEVLEIQQQVNALVEGLPSERLQKLGTYNLACFLSLNGRTDEALEALRKVLPGDAQLSEMARHDPDLEAVRSRTEFEALVAGR